MTVLDTKSNAAHLPFNLILKNMSQGIIELSPDGRIAFVNNAATSFFKKDDIQLLGTHFISLIPEKERWRFDNLSTPDGDRAFSIPDSDPMALNNRLFAMESLAYTSEKRRTILIMTDVTRIQRESHTRRETETSGWGGRIVNMEQQLHVLSIEDDNNDYRQIQSVLNTIEGIRLSRAVTFKEGLRLVDEISPDLVLLDYLLPGGDAFDFIKAIKASGKEIPLVILTGQGDEMVATRLIEEGADDYLIKTRFDRESIAACFRNVMEKGKLKREIRSAHRKISEMATLDELTGLHNRRYFMEALERERSRAERHRKALSLCMITIDNFKRINDKLGHTAGDLVLADMGRTIREWSRQTDLACRYGGEEFAVILPETDLEGARVACERLRHLAAENRVQWRTGPIQVTVSIGVTENRTVGKDSLRELIDRADGALYQAKETGRNRVKVGE